MDEIRDALLRLVKAGRRIKRLQEAYLDVGLKDTPLLDSYGDICDAIYSLIGERTEEYKDCVTDIVMTAPFLTEERRVEMLMAEYRKNHGTMPRPNIMTPEDMKDMTRKNGGYSTPEGDWL